MKQATLPARLERRDRIDQMKPGEMGFTVPWAMWADSHGKLWLHPGYSIKPVAQGTSDLCVARFDDGTYHVRIIVNNNHRWEKQALPGYLSSSDTQYIPVASIE